MDDTDTQTKTENSPLDPQTCINCGGGCDKGEYYCASCKARIAQG